jgi:signal transduction histidine kinase
MVRGSLPRSVNIIGWHPRKVFFQMSSIRDLFPRLVPVTTTARGAGKNGEGGDFRGRIGRRLSLLLCLLFIVVLVIGGISLLSARSIHLSTEEIDQQTQHIEDIDDVHVYVHRLIFGVQESIINHTPFPEAERQQIRAAVRERLDRYAKREATEKDFPEKEEEAILFAEIRNLVGRVNSSTRRLSEAVESGKDIDQEDLRYLTHANTAIPILSHGMAAIHQAKIDRLLSESRKKMWIIFGFYVAFILIGSLLVFGSSVVFHGSIVQPIRRLASATVELSKGDFRKRVPVTSQDEMGQLAHSFNVMAERLEEHEMMLQALATQEERERIAQELHDSLAQDLALIYLKLGDVEMNLARTTSTAADETLREMRKIADGAYENVRQAIFGLRTMVSRGLGFIPTLTEYLHDFSEMRKLPVDLKVQAPEAVRFSPREEIQLIRIIHEALTNVFKHARASKCTLDFERDGDFSKVTIEDNGDGFVPMEAQRKVLHFGLKTMRERAEGVGGRLAIESALGKGTKVVVTLPLEKREPDETYPRAVGR